VRASRLEPIDIGGITFRVRHWGDDSAPLLFMLHGWLDSAATFQFVVDALKEEWHVVAPDLRGHGGSHRTHESYFFMQLVADLDAMLERYSPAQPVRLVGHSWGANVSSVFAGVRPERVSHLVNLEGLAPIPGFRKGSPGDIIGQWLTNLRAGPQNRRYANHAELAARLRKANPRLAADRALFFAQEFSRARRDGGLEFDVDPYQHVATPWMGHQDVVDSVWPRIVAPVLLVTGSDSFAIKAFEDHPGLLQRRMALVRNLKHVNLLGAGHNVHHDRPERIAELIEHFLRNAHRENMQ
jgi:pimeloyl-ACP methyl ester carboxylesterase